MDGIIGRKLGMTQLFREDGVAEAVTVIDASPCAVVQVKTVEKEGYNAVQLGYGKAKKLTSPEKGHLKGIGEFGCLREFRMDEIEGINVGDKVDVGMFQPGDTVDVIGISKGKGFAGVVKRHGFGGGPKTHGQSDRWRAPGSIGSGTTPGRVKKGMKMAGRMGNDRVTARNLVVVKADTERNILVVKGAVPGANNGIILIGKSGK
ncbi:MAG: 50S ribosomal protein L3 [Dehalococcoidales bacterium]|nr:50S ribosomal protein L3 [Dehalococcoidales bacterium]